MEAEGCSSEASLRGSKSWSCHCLVTRLSSLPAGLPCLSSTASYCCRRLCESVRPQPEHCHASELQLGQCSFSLAGFLLTDRKAVAAVYLASERPCLPEPLTAPSLPLCTTPSRFGLQENAIVNMKQSQILHPVKT